ncbi:polysaccharide biosynthesis tyrosine autokinase [Vibrio sp. RE86]|uniref:GumC family protein n=1 Tax=Vibrio sp. RE86 TaxID=2607605 RepID=UPI0014932ECC|nr:polysaccharide biosynthesis tyrosine autokinase [Vibrio sp. RE86]NOH79906.1 polysaccharide biosynthesis tyrosine autokinase [Vibrio sp. RE86]
MQLIAKDQNMNNEEVIDLGKYLILLQKSWLRIAMFTILVMALTTLIVFSITPKYEATSTLLIEAQAQKAVSIEEVVGIDSNQKEYYLTQFEILKSNQIAERVIETLKLEERLEFNATLSRDKSLKQMIKALPLFKAYGKEEAKTEAQIQESIRQDALVIFADNLTISPIRKTQLVKISFISEDPELAAEVANAVGNAYIELNVEARLAATKDASLWISNRLEELKEQLAGSERKLTDYLNREQLIDDSGIDALVSSEINSLSERLAEVTDRRIEVESAYNALRIGKGKDIVAVASIPVISTHPQVVEIRSIQVEAEKAVKELSLRYGPEHVKMAQAVAELESVKAQGKELVRQLLKGMGQELMALRGQEKLLHKEFDAKKSEFQLLTVKKREYETLKRDVETNRQVLNLFLTRQKETTATSDFEAANARFSDYARVPQKPAAPKKGLIIGLAMVASMGFAIVMVFLVDSLRSTITSVKDFEERFGLVPLGGIPQVLEKRFKKRDLDNTVFDDKTNLQFAESIRSIRTALTLSQMGSDRKRLAITSSLPNEGKTTTSINLAMAYAKMENVLLIDGDLRKPSVAERFGFKKYQQGLTNHLLMGTDLNQCLIKDEATGLTILPAGMLTPTPQELLSSDKFAELLDELEQHFDRIIIDTPPTLPISDTMIISKLVGGVAIVVKANGTRIASMKNTLARYMGQGINIDGIIVNQVTQKSLKADSTYGGYGKYGTYGTYGENPAHS